MIQKYYFQFQFKIMFKNIFKIYSLFKDMIQKYVFQFQFNSIYPARLLSQVTNTNTKTIRR